MARIFAVLSLLTLNLGPIGVSSASSSGTARAVPKIHAQAAIPEALSVANVNTTNEPMAQNTPSLAINPLNESELMGSVNDYRPSANNDSNCGYIHSSDGGQTWISGIIPGITRGNGGFYDHAWGSHQFVFGGTVRASFSCRALDRDLERSALLYTSTSDGGATWSTPVPVYASETIDDFQGPGSVAIDNNPSSPTFGRIYVAWTRHFDRMTTSRIYGSCSDDDGATWTAPFLISGEATTAQGPAVTFGSDNLAIVVWGEEGVGGWNIHFTADPGQAACGEARRPQLVQTGVRLPSPLPGNDFAVNSFPALAYCPWCVTETVTLAYADYSLGHADILFVRSEDGGATWSTPIRVNSRLQDDQFFPALAVSRTGVIWVCYYDQSWNRSNFLDVSCSRSRNGGLSFERARRVTAQSSDPALDGFGGTWIGDGIGLAVTRSGFPRAIWMDTRTGNAEAYTLTP